MAGLRKFAVMFYLFGVILYSTGLTMVSGQACAPIGSTVVKIPAGLGLQKFTDNFLDRWIPEVYYVLPKPPSYSPDFNYWSRFTKVSNNLYHQDTFGDFTSSGQTQCARRPVNLTLINSHHAEFTSTNQQNLIEVFWSSCPGSYVWHMRCHDWYPGSHKCRWDMSEFGLFVTNSENTLEDLSLHDALRDLCQTGVKFGAQNYKWFFVFGESEMC